MRLARTLTTVGASMAAAFALLGPTAPPAQAADRDPVLFVHGLDENASFYDDMIGDFVAAGWSPDRLHAISYNSWQSSAITAQEIADEVSALRARTGAAKVDIVAHSLGALNTRWYLKFLGGTSYVDDWVAIAGPNYGTYWAGGCLHHASCREAYPGSTFLDQLNSGDVTPGNVTYNTIWSSCDEVITPNSHAQLAGADNWHAGCVGHVTLLFQDAVAVRAQQVVA
ncbi:esterase/lipase family protein [Streptomyces sp. NPDC055815]